MDKQLVLKATFALFQVLYYPVKDLVSAVWVSVVWKCTITSNKLNEDIYPILKVTALLEYMHVLQFV